MLQIVRDWNFVFGTYYSSFSITLKRNSVTRWIQLLWIRVSQRNYFIIYGANVMMICILNWLYLFIECWTGPTHSLMEMMNIFEVHYNFFFFCKSFSWTSGTLILYFFTVQINKAGCIIRVVCSFCFCCLMKRINYNSVLVDVAVPLREPRNYNNYSEVIFGCHFSEPITGSVRVRIIKYYDEDQQGSLRGCVFLCCCCCSTAKR